MNRDPRRHLQGRVDVLFEVLLGHKPASGKDLAIRIVQTELQYRVGLGEFRMIGEEGIDQQCVCGTRMDAHIARDQPDEARIAVAGQLAMQ